MNLLLSSFSAGAKLHCKNFLFIVSLSLFSVITMAQPVVNNFSPTSGPIGTSVTITGTGFNATAANNIVFFGATRATVTTATTTSLAVSVPSGSTHEPISVTVNNLTGYSQGVFTVTFSAGVDFTSAAFSPKTDYASGTNTRHVEITDLDNDGKSDVLALNTGSNNLSVFRNISSSGTISLNTRQDFYTGNGTTGAANLCTGDFDGDGKKDIALTVSNQFVGDSIFLFRNTSTIGTISLAARVRVSVPPGSGMVIGDVNSDGKPDLVVPTASLGTISIYRNTSTPGNITFAARVDIPVSASNTRLALGDIDSDGKIDIAVSEPLFNLISVFRNTSTIAAISFAPKVNYSVGSQIWGIAVRDLNSDGKPEIIGQSSSNAVIVLKNNSTSGSVLLDPAVSFPGPSGGSGNITVSDIDGDGRPDVAVNMGSVAFSLLRNVGTAGTIAFNPKVDYISTLSTENFVIGDLNSNALPDIVSANASTGNISVFTNKITDPIISSFTPQTANSGTTITITGVNFTGATNVSFGGVPAASFTVVSPTSINAVVGAGATGNVAVTVAGITTTLTGFTFLPPPTITSFSPTSTGANGSIIITGTNFLGASAVSFGGTPATSFTINSASSISAIVSTGTTGSVTVTGPDGIGTSAGIFTFVDAPVISNVSPLTAGTGTTVTISGNNLTGATSVKFGGTNPASFSIVNSNTITAQIAAGASGDVIVTTVGGTASFAGFTYIPPPTITSFSPLSAGAGTTIIVTGTNLTTASAVSFGGVAAASFTVVSATRIDAVVGIGASGSVSVTTIGGAATRTGFQFIPAPVISSFTPAIAATGGFVSINGSNLFGATAVSFGGVPASSFISIYNGLIYACVGPGASGNVSVTTAGGSSSLAGFTYNPLPKITSFSPEFGGCASPNSITISGLNFTGTSAVKVGGIDVNSFTINSSTSITAVVAGEQSGVVSITNPSGTAITQNSYGFGSGIIPFAFIPNSTDGTVSVVNTLSNTVVSSLNPGGNPESIVLSPDGSKVYVGVSTSNRVQIYNTLTNALITTITITTPTALALSPDGSKLYVANSTGNIVSIINTTTNLVTGSYSISGPAHMITSADGGFLYVASKPNNAVIRVNTVTNAQTFVNVSLSPGYLTLNPDGTKMYVANNLSNNVTVINMFDFTALANISVGTNPTCMSMNSNGSKLYVTNFGNSTVSVINTSNNAVTAITVSPNPYGISISPDDNTLYVTSSANNLVSTISTATNTVTGTINVGAGPKGLGNFIGKVVTPCLPIVSSFTPTSGCSGNTVVITGNYFSGISSVKFGGSEATSFVVNNVNTITAVVGEGVTGNVSVTSTWGTGTSSAIFTSTCPFITNFNPATLNCTGSTVTITGTNLTGTTAVNFGSTPAASFIVNSSTSITAQVTGTTTSGRVSVTTAEGTAYSAASFAIGNSFTQYAYITNTNSNNVSVINLTTNTVLATIPVGTQPTAIVTTTNGKYVYVANANSRTISVISTATNTVISSILLFNIPRALEISKDGNKLFAIDDSYIYGINTNTNTITNQVNSSSNNSLELSLDGSKLYILNSSGSLLVYNTVSFTNTRTIAVGGSGTSMRLSPNGTLLYISLSTGIVSVINTFSNTRVNFITVNSSPQGIGFSPDGTKAYVCNQGSNNVSIINTATSSVTLSVPVGMQPKGIQVSPDGSKVYVTNQNSNSVSVIDTLTNTVVSTIPVGTVPASTGRFIITVVAVCAPSISLFSPASSACGSSVTIIGNNLLNSISVKAGAIDADSFIVNSNTQVTAWFQPGSAGLISLVTPGGTATSGSSYNSTCPSISAITPLSGCDGTSISITGTNFTGVSAVKIGGADAASYVVNSPTSITAIAGIGFNGPVSVNTSTGLANSKSFFTYGTTTNPFVYVANSASNSVSVINGSTNLVVSTIPITSAPSTLTVSPDGSKVYVNTNTSPQLKVIHAATNTVANSINASPSNGMVFSPDGSKLYLLGVSNVRSLNTLTNMLSATIPITSPTGIAISTDGKKVFIGTQSSRIKILNTSDNSISDGPLLPGNAPVSVTVSPDGSKLFTTYINAVYIFNADNYSYIGQINDGTTPKGIAFNSDGSRAYVCYAGSGWVTVWNTVSNTIAARITVGTTPTAISVSQDGTKMFVINQGSNNVSIINTATNTVSTTVPVGTTPTAFANFTAMVPTPCAPVISSFDPLLVCASGSTVTIKGANFTGTTSVRFNGVNAASFIVVSDTIITAVTGIANNSGLITVTTAWGTFTSTTNLVMSNIPAFLPNPNPFQLCAGSPRQFNPNIAGDFTYVSNNGQSGNNIIFNAPGTYTVTATDQYGCSNSSTFNVTNYASCSGYLEIESEPVFNYFDTLRVKIKIKGGVDIFSTFAYLNFNTTHLKYVGHVPGDYLGANIFVQDPIVTGGQIDFGMSHITGDPGTNGDGTIWEFIFVLADQIPNIAAFNATRPEFFTTNLTLSNLSIFNVSGVQPPSFPALSMLNKPVACRYYVPVWPGDLNFDKKVTVADILPIGYFYLSTGPVRPNASLAWIAQPSALWGFDKTNKTRSAYRTFADGTPDGVINLADQTSIGFNLNRSHLRVASSADTYVDPAIENALGIPTINVSMPDEVIPASSLPKNEIVTLSLGSVANPLNNVYGLAFDVFFNPAAVNINAITTNYSGSIFGTLGSNFTRIEDRTGLAQGRFSIGVTRYNTNGINAAGGNIMTITLPLLASAPQGKFQVTAIPVGCNDPVGNDLVVGSGADSLIINTGLPCTTNNWQGTVSSAWEDPANWSCGSVPDANSIVDIRAANPYMPEVRSMAVCKSLNIRAGMVVNVITGFRINILGP